MRNRTPWCTSSCAEAIRTARFFALSRSRAVASLHKNDFSISRSRQASTRLQRTSWASSPRLSASSAAAFARAIS